jgi:predicted metalloprotease
MRWKGRQQSTNVEDRRGRRVATKGRVGGGFVIIAILAALIFGIDPNQLLDMAGGAAALQQSGPASGPSPESDETAQFASTVLKNTEDAWIQVFSDAGGAYQAPVMVLFTDGVQSACGFNSSATGPFYCPGDDKLYLDLGFFRELERLGAPGDFATAYVIAHEVGHHVQNLVGTEREVRSLRSRLSQAEANRMSVMVELQADCYAGIWANYAARDGDLLDEGDIQEGLQAAASIGDDRLQRMAGRSVQPESFTHGSSAQRQEWFTRGLRSGDLQSCDTFSGI